jgi:hypothetical protein
MFCSATNFVLQFGRSSHSFHMLNVHTHFRNHKIEIIIYFITFKFKLFTLFTIITLPKGRINYRSTFYILWNNYQRLMISPSVCNKEQLLVSQQIALITHCCGNTDLHCFFCLVNTLSSMFTITNITKRFTFQKWHNLVRFSQSIIVVFNITSQCIQKCGMTRCSHPVSQNPNILGENYWWAGKKWHSDTQIYVTGLSFVTK